MVDRLFRCYILTLLNINQNNYDNKDTNYESEN